VTAPAAAICAFVSVAVTFCGPLVTAATLAPTKSSVARFAFLPLLSWQRNLRTSPRYQIAATVALTAGSAFCGEKMAPTSWRMWFL
jgi:hypothetical protein